MQNVIVLGGSYAGSSYPIRENGSTQLTDLFVSGARAAHLLAHGLGNKFRVILIDRNRCVYLSRACRRVTHKACSAMQTVCTTEKNLAECALTLLADLYVFPRLAVLPGHEHKACAR